MRTHSCKSFMTNAKYPMPHKHVENNSPSSLFMDSAAQASAMIEKIESIVMHWKCLERSILFQMIRLCPYIKACLRETSLKFNV